jgi:predicted small lipoprotein YifL
MRSHNKALSMPVRFISLLLISLFLAACGRAGPMLRPEPGVTIMKEADKPAEPAAGKPFVLDKLL